MSTIGANQARTPITEDDDFLARVVEDVGLVQLLCSVVHMTGSLDILDGVRTRPMLLTGDGSGRIREPEAAQLRARALAAITSYRDAGSPEPYRPDDAELHRMISFLVGTDLGDRYVPVIREEMAYDEDARRFVWPHPVSDEVRSAHPVLIIGAGMSGLILAHRLHEAGIPVRVIEKNTGIGGTWHENRYPGCRVDVPSHSYSMSFMQDYPWPTLYSPQSELESYFNAFVDRFGLRPLVSFETEVLSADYDESDHLWDVALRGPDGREDSVRVRSLVSAVGQLNRPRVPDLPGLESFSGLSFHTARWPEDLDLTARRVAVVGAAATGAQVIPEIAGVAAAVSVFMRSSNWMMIHPHYRRPISDSEQWAFEHLPYYSGWTRTLNFSWPFDLDASRFKIDPGWTGGVPGKLSTSESNELTRLRLTEGIEAFLADTPHLIDKVVPDYPPFMKRPNVIDGSFLRALQSDHVELVTDGIERVVPDGIIDRTGQLHEVDVIVFATGFHAQKFLHPMAIRGRDGVELNDWWGDEPGGLYGITVPRFPNFYMMYGPNTNLGFNGTLIFNSECQAGYITRCIGGAIAGGREEVEVRQDAYDAYQRTVEHELKDFVWTLDHTTNWFKNDKGRVTTNSPWSCVQYWEWTREPSPEDFVH